jgi:hypothetical protein
MNTLALAFAAALLAQAATPAPKTAGDPIPGLLGMPGTSVTKPKHDTVKNSIGNTHAEAADPIPGVVTPTTRHPAAKTDPQGCTPTPTKPCPATSQATPRP